MQIYSSLEEVLNDPANNFTSNASQKLIRQGYTTNSQYTKINIGKDNMYHSQRNNKRKPHKTCNTTAMTMFIKYAGMFNYSDEIPNGVQAEDYLYDFIQNNEKLDKLYKSISWARGVYPKEQVHIILNNAANLITKREFTYFKSDCSIKELANTLIDLKRHRPAVISGNFPYYSKRNKAVIQLGHIATLTGIIIKGNIIKDKVLVESPSDNILCFIVDDPYGDVNTLYKSTKGNNVPIDLELFSAIYKGFSHLLLF